MDRLRTLTISLSVSLLTTPFFSLCVYLCMSCYQYSCFLSLYPQNYLFALLFLFTAFLCQMPLLAILDHLFACLVFFLTLFSILLSKALADWFRTWLPSVSSLVPLAFLEGTIFFSASYNSVGYFNFNFIQSEIFYSIYDCALICVPCVISDVYGFYSCFGTVLQFNFIWS